MTNEQLNNDLNIIISSYRDFYTVITQFKNFFFVNLKSTQGNLRITQS